MRRLLSTIAAAMPLLASAQTAGQVLFDSNTTVTVTRSQCQTESLGLTWKVQPQVAGDFVPNTGEFDVYSAAADKTDAFPFCHYANDGSSITSALVAGPFTAPASDASLSPTNVTITDLFTKAGFDCTTSDRTAHVCVVWKNADGVVKAYAKGKVDLKVAMPAAPVVRTVRAGDRALYATVDAGPRQTGDVEATTFKAVAVGKVCPATLPACDTTTRHESDETAIGDEARIGGLTNDVQYEVTAFAYSDVGNESLESAPYAYGSVGEVTPRYVRNAWEEYLAAGGRDSGGCQAGAAGLAALLGSAALLRLRRRS